MRKLETRLVVDALFLAVAAGAVGYAFIWLIDFFQGVMLEGIAGFRPPHLNADGSVTPGHAAWATRWLIPVSTVIGGIIAGALIKWGAAEAKGLATDATVKAYHLDGGRIRLRAVVTKMLATAVTLGSGGSAGREGTAAYIAGGLGSVYGRLAQRTEDEQRLLVLVGMAAGISVLFRCPIGAAFFAVEVLYSRMAFEAKALFYTLVAAIAAFAVFAPWRQQPTLFDFPEAFVVRGWRIHIEFLLLGTACGLFGAILPTAFYRCRDAFDGWHAPALVKPAIGGLGVGCIGLAVPAVLGAGYGWIQQLIDGDLTGWFLVVLLCGKLFAFILTLASGSSGGVFTPTMYLGAVLGAVVAWISSEPASAFAVVGMAALFGGAARVPIASLLMVVEMTGGFDLMVPAALAVVVSYFVQIKITNRLKYRHFYMHEAACA